jgi:hypothetical protein
MFCVLMHKFAQCQMIQVPALAALLPKLHLNQHYPRAVLFSAPKYNDLGFINIYVDQGYCQHVLFIGHIKLGNDISRMILSLLRHLQLLISSYYTVL